MATPKEFEQRYQKGDLPWDQGVHDRNLEEVINDYSISSCSVLELGAGTGSDAVWLVKQGYKVTAIDVSSTAVEMARDKAEKAGVDVDIINADVLKADIPNRPFKLVFDRGCFHSIDPTENKSQLVDIIHRNLEPDGYWFSLIGSADGPDREHGPPKMSVMDIASLVESRFELIHLKSIYLDTNLSDPPRAWACLMRRRDINL